MLSTIDVLKQIGVAVWVIALGVWVRNLIDAFRR